MQNQKVDRQQKTDEPKAVKIQGVPSVARNIHAPRKRKARNKEA